MDKVSITSCRGCGIQLPEIAPNDPTHLYMLSSPACWQLYGELLAWQYSDISYGKVHRLTVDTYAIQHPGDQHDQRARQSVSVHLASLYLIFIKNYNYTAATKAISAIIQQHRSKFPSLPIPEQLGQLTVQDVLKTKNSKQYQSVVERWAKASWEAWETQHPYIEQLVNNTSL